MTIARMIQQAAAGVLAPSQAWTLNNITIDGSIGDVFDLENDFDTYSAQGVAFSADGTYMYVSGLYTLTQYTLSTAWDITTATKVFSFNGSGEISFSPSGIYFKPDGTKVYFCSLYQDNLYEYSMSTAWDISTMSQTYSVSCSAQDTNSRDIYIKADGTTLFMIGSTNDSVYEYSMSTAWDLSTVSYVKSFSVATRENTPAGIFFDPTGIYMYVVGEAGNDINTWELSTAWDISTATYTTALGLTNQSYNPRGCFFKEDGTKFYFVAGGGAAILQLSLSTAWSILSATWAGPSNTAPTIEPSLTDVRISSDGYFIYGVGSGNDRIYKHHLATPYDLTSVTTSDYYAFSTNNSYPVGLSFNNDGTKLFIIHYLNKVIQQYSMTTAYDVTSLSYDSITFDISTWTSFPWSMKFKPDGTICYISDYSTKSINQFALSTAWDITTMSYTTSFSDTSSDTLRCITIDPTGSIVITSDSLAVFRKYVLSTAWDISSAVYDSKHHLGYYESGYYFDINQDGTKLVQASVTVDKFLMFNLV